MAPMWHGNNYSSAQELRRRLTRSERLAWETLRARRLNGLKFYRQRPWGPFVLDFYCPALRLAIEIDGAVHAGAEQRRHDDARQRVLEDQGIRFVRVSAEDVEAAPGETLATAIATLLGESDPAPTPLHEGGEGQG